MKLIYCRPEFPQSYIPNYPRRELMWLGLGNPWGWLALTGHHWPPLAKQVIQTAIKVEFEPIYWVWLLCMLIYAYVRIPFEWCASDYWEMSPNLPFPSPSILFSSIAGMEHYIAVMEVWSELVSASIMVRSSSREFHASPMLSTPLLVMFRASCPLFWSLLCNGQYIILFMICSSI